MSLELPGVFLAGLLTFFSPCILPLVPLYLSFLAGVSVSDLREGTSTRVRRPWGVALAFSLGLSTVFVALGMAATFVGGQLEQHRELLLRFGGLTLFLFGLKQLGVIQIPWLDRESRPWLGRVQKGGSVAGAFLFGAAFGLGWTPCIGPVLGGVLTLTATSTSNPFRGAMLLATYAAGLSAPLLGTAAIAPLALRFLERAKRHLRKFEMVTGAMLALVGVLLFTDSLSALVPTLAQEPVVAAAVEPSPSGASCTPEPGGEGTCALPEEPSSPAPKTAMNDALPLAGVVRPTMVEFISETCTVCQRMDPVVRELERACAGRGVNIVRIDVGTTEGRLAARRHGVRGVPTFLFLDGSGTESSRRIGEQSLATLQTGLEAISGSACAGVLTPRNAPTLDGLLNRGS